jgi:hypothetical protein
MNAVAKTAKYVRTLPKQDWQGTAKLYELSEPVQYGYDYETKQPKGSTSFVAVSAACVWFEGGRPETYIFPSDENGKVLDWGELPGSYKGGLDHEKALDNAGFSIG